MFYVTFGLLNKYWNRLEDNDATSDSELQSSDSEDPDNSEDDAQSLFINGRLYRSQYEVLLSQTLMSNALQYKTS